MYAEVTDKIRVAVEPFFIEDQSDPAAGRWLFGYRVTITNEGERPVQLVSRHWRITDGRGMLSEVRGAGVVGEQPRLEPGRSFTYTSGAPLPTPTGIMQGSYELLDDTGRSFVVRIPAFSLDAPGPRGPLN